MLYDVIIIGSGPAGLTAGIYTSRDNLKTLILGGGKWGGQLMLTTEVDNFPGFPSGILGPDLMASMKSQAERFGVVFKTEDVTKVDFNGAQFKVYSLEQEYESRSVIVASGADTIWLGLANEQRLIGKGVSSCAACDAFFFKGKRVIVVGGGDAAMEEAITLAKFATEVTVVHRRESCRASKIMFDRASALTNVKFKYNTVVTDILGEAKVSGVKLQSTVDKSEETMDIDGVFVAIGHSPNTKIFEGQLGLDNKGYILRTGEKEHGVDIAEHAHDHYSMMTSVPGVFVAGDVHDHHFKQAVTAAAFGCMAALEVSRYLQQETK